MFSQRYVHLVPINVTLFGKGFADVIKNLEMIIPDYDGPSVHWQVTL